MKAPIVLCALILAHAAARAQPAAPQVRGTFDQTASSLLQASGAPSVSIAIVENESTVYAKAFGDANLAAHRPATTQTRYAVGSVSKQFTVAALLLLQEAGKLSLDDTVAKYFPELTRANEVTIRQLLSHTSGYEDYAPQDYIIPDWTHPTTPRAILDHWGKKPLNFDPGTRWQYSNTNYVVAGEIFEKAAGQGLLEFLKAKIFDPLEMSTASDCSEANPADATAYTRYALGPPRPVAREANGWYFAAGELCMTPSDLAKWDIAVLQKQILSPQSYKEFTTEMKLKNGAGTHYALGLSVGDLNGTPVLAHSGEVSGFLASNTVFPAKGTAVVVLSNEDGINLIGSLARALAIAALEPAKAGAANAESSRIRSVLERLQGGTIDHSLFTANANSYFSDVALGDYKKSLTALGALQRVSKTSEQQRGGMTHLSYRAEFERKTVLLNIYVMPDGKFEQFLVEEQL